jgi:thiol-disulfide isomerase/thioredoxin
MVDKSFRLKPMKSITEALVLAIGLIIYCREDVFAQNARSVQNPEIGKSVPAFTLEKIGNYGKTTASSKDLTGSFIILDFWNKGCVSCIQSFPKLNEVHEKYKGKLHIILIGTEEDGIDEMFERSRKRLGLKFPYAYNFPLYKQFVPQGAPHLLWIDDKGIVQAITSGDELKIRNIEAFLKGESFDFIDRSHNAYAKSAYTEYDPDKPYLVNGNGGDESDFIYRSLLGKRKPGTPSKAVYDVSPLTPFGDKMVYEGVGSLRELYTVAYTGKLQWRYGDSIYRTTYGKIMFELDDTTKFKVNRETGEGLYWYSLIVPAAKATPEHIMEGMQRDLHYYFGYEARVETRMLPCWRLSISDQAKEKLKTKGGTYSGESDYTFYKVTNAPVENVFRNLFNFNNYWENRTLPIVNETGMEGNVDVDIKVNITDWSDVQRALKELGFSLVKSERVFKVIVVAESK